MTPKQEDFAPADVVAFLQARREFADATPLGSIQQAALFGNYQLWRIAEQLERLADYRMVDSMDEPPVEPWRDNSDDDE